MSERRSSRKFKFCRFKILLFAGVHRLNRALTLVLPRFAANVGLILLFAAKRAHFPAVECQATTSIAHHHLRSSTAHALHTTTIAIKLLARYIKHVHHYQQTSVNGSDLVVLTRFIIGLVTLGFG